MAVRSTPCPQRAGVEALANGFAAGDEKRKIERHLERCESCRLTYRQQVGGRYPRLRSYTIIEEIGRGGFGVVYKAVHHSKGRIEAVKVLFGTTALREAYFENEVHLVAGLQHPNIATLYEAHLTSEPHFYAMEFVEGQQLDDYVRTAGASLEQRISIVKSVATAIAHAHRAGVIHRDLKPQNLLIDAAGQPHILDFGIAKRLVRPEEEADAAAPQAEGPMGTYGYMSPEQIAGQTVDGRADVYSLGALLFHVITGQPARQAVEGPRVRTLLRDRQVIRADDLAAIIACCVQHFPEHRYADCAAFVDDLDNYLAGRPIHARAGSTTTGYRFARTAALLLRHHLLTVQAVMAAVVAAGLAFFLWHLGIAWLSAPGPPGQAVLVAFQPSTQAALVAGEFAADLPGLSPDNRKSWRLLYGRLMERLARARPRVVVWDYFFRTCEPEYDDAFIRGVRALAAPVIVGAEKMDINGEPELCPAITDAVQGWGHLKGWEGSVNSGSLVLPFAIQHGLNPPVPALAVAGAAAAQHPDCSLELRASLPELQLRYRRLHVEAEQRRWLTETDRLPLVTTRSPTAANTEYQVDELVMFGAVELGTLPPAIRTPIPFEDVLRADDHQLRQWFDGRAVLLGQMLPRVDMKLAPDGAPIFGCQLQSLALERLLAGSWTQRATRAEVATCTCIGCALGVVIARLLPVRRARRRARLVVFVALALAVGSVAAAGLTPLLTERWALELYIVGCALVTGGAAAYLLKQWRARQLELTPTPLWPVENSTVSSTLLATGSESPGAPGARAPTP